MNKKARILVVDDDPDWLRAASRRLKSAGYEALEASTGGDGLRLAKEQRPDPVLLDVVLPDADGIEVCKRIKADLEMMRVYVLLLIGVCVHDLLSPEAAAFGKAKVEQVIQGGQPVRFEDQHGGRWRDHKYGMGLGLLSMEERATLLAGPR